MALKPQFDITQTYNDNITYRETEVEADFLTVVSPGLGVQFGSHTYNYIDFGYHFDRIQYWDNDDLSANQHRADLQMRIEKSRFLLEGFDQFRNLSSPIGGGISIGGVKVDRITLLDQYKLTYDASEKSAVYLEGFHTRTDYESDLALYDTLTISGTLGFEYKALSKTSFFGELYYGFTEAEKNLESLADYPTARFVGGFVGARGNFTEQLVGTVKVGYEHRTYNDDLGNPSAPVVGVSLTKQFAEGTILTLAYSRTQRESVQFVRSSYVNDTVVVDFLQHLADAGRLRGGLNLIYASSSYDENPQFVSGSRQDHLFLAGLTITYDIKLWWRAFGSYNFEYLDSNEPTISDYKVNRIALGMQLGF